MNNSIEYITSILIKFNMYKSKSIRTLTYLTLSPCLLILADIGTFLLDPWPSVFVKKKRAGNLVNIKIRFISENRVQIGNILK